MSSIIRQVFLSRRSMALSVFFAYAMIVYASVPSSVPLTFAQATTDNYTIPLETPSSGGGEESKSANYVLEDTIGQPGVGDSSTDNYDLDAGYRQALSEFLSVSCDFDTDLGTIIGIGQKTGTLTCTVIMDSDAGYNLSWIVEEGRQGVGTGYLISATDLNDRIPPLDPAVDGVPETWSVGSTDARWGGRLSSTSTDTDSKWGTDSVDEKWLNVGTGSTTTVVERDSRTAVAGSTEVIQFRTEIGTSKVQPTGVYEATVDIIVSSL